MFCFDFGLSTIWLSVIFSSFTFFAQFCEETVNYGPHICIDGCKRGNFIAKICKNQIDINLPVNKSPTASQASAVINSPSTKNMIN